MDTGELRRSFERVNVLPGWFLSDAALMFMAYNQLVADRVGPGNTLEIGAYCGKSSSAVASLRGEAIGPHSFCHFDGLHTSTVTLTVNQP